MNLRSRISSFLILFLSFVSSFALDTDGFSCSALQVAAPTHLIGKNYDWHQDHGLLLVNKRNVQKKQFGLSSSAAQIPWKSKYGSLSFHQHGLGMPVGGINEMGLVIEALWLSDSKYPGPDERYQLNELQWIQYNLDLYKTTQEVRENVQLIRVSPIFAKVHYFVCDRSGDCATFEYINGQLVFSDEPAPIRALTNSQYPESLKFASSYKVFGGNIDELPNGSGSLERFVRAGAWAAETRHRELADVLSGLENLKSTNTVWQIAYDPVESKIFFRTKRNPGVRHVSFSHFNFSCDEPVQALDINGRLVGDLSEEFSEMTVSQQNEQVEQAIVLLREGGLSEDFLEKMRQLSEAYLREGQRCLN